MNAQCARILRLFPVNPALAAHRAAYIAAAQDAAREELAAPAYYIKCAGTSAAAEFNRLVSAMVAKAAEWDGREYLDRWQFAYCEIVDSRNEWLLEPIEAALRANEMAL